MNRSWRDNPRETPFGWSEVTRMAADRDKDDIAAALHGLNAGHHDSTAEHAEDAHAEHLHEASPPPASRAANPPAARPVPPPPQQQQQRPATPVKRPAMPAPIPPPASPPSRSSSSPPSSSSSGRVRPSSPMRPAAPDASASALAPAPADEGEFTTDDENVPVNLDEGPAPPVDYRGPATSKPIARPQRTPLFKTLGFRRTVIPVMLTLGIMMIVMGAARWVVDEEAPLTRMPPWVTAVLFAAGALMLVLGVANMLMVRGELAKRAG
jgi:hypothetical protein